jgi:CRP-like cAMP-binding protein
LVDNYEDIIWEKMDETIKKNIDQIIVGGL